MDVLTLIRTMGALTLLLGALGAALWAVRRYDIQLPGRVGGGTRRRVEVVERLSLDAKRSIALIRRDGHEHLMLIAPDGHVMIESGIRQEPAREAPVAQAETATEGKAEAPAAPFGAGKVQQDLAQLRRGFGALVERANGRMPARTETIAPRAAVPETPAAAATPAPAPMAEDSPAPDADLAALRKGMGALLAQAGARLDSTAPAAELPAKPARARKPRARKPGGAQPIHA